MNRSRILAAVSIALVLTLGACGGDPEPDTTAAAMPPPKVMQVSGQFTLELPDFQWNPGECGGRGAYDDLVTGAPVVVTDNAGVTVGMGKLGDGDPELDPSDSTRAIACIFFFAVGDIPTGKGFYGIEVGGHGRVQFTEAQLAAESVQLELT